MSDEVANLDDHRGDGRRKKNRHPHDEISQRNVRKHDPGLQIRRLKCFVDVDEMVRRGAFVRDIVTFIHGEGEMTHLSAKAAAQVVMRYKRHVLSNAEAIADDKPPDAVDDVDKDNPASVVFTMQEMFYLMRDRITMEAETEKALKKLFSTTHREFMMMNMMGRDLVKLMDKFDMIDPEVLQGGPQRSGPEVPGRLDLGGIATNPESRQKILGVLNIMLSKPDMLKNVLGKMREEATEKRRRPKRRKRKKKTESN